MKRNLIITGFFVMALVSGFGFGEEGHRAIARAAFARLNPKAQKAVAAIMAHSTVPELKNVVTAATWPDDIRLSDMPAHSGKLVKRHDPAALDFNNRFKTNHVWHYVDYPLDGVYSLDGQFSSPEDAVHIIEHCVKVLEGSARGKWAAMRQDEALAWVIHLVADLLQPLHVGEGFYKFDGNRALLITDPALAYQNRLHSDRGGNELFYTKTEEFHAFWDNVMVEHVSPNEDELVQVISNSINKASYHNSGVYHHWAENWATDSIHAAKEAYTPLVTGKDRSIGTRRSPTSSQIDIKLDPAAYQKQHADLIRQQLGKAAYNLADLLNHLRWK